MVTFSQFLKKYLYLNNPKTENEYLDFVKPGIKPDKR